MVFGMLGRACATGRPLSSRTFPARAGLPQASIYPGFHARQRAVWPAAGYLTAARDGPLPATAARARVGPGRKSRPFARGTARCGQSVPPRAEAVPASRPWLVQAADGFESTAPRSVRVARGRVPASATLRRHPGRAAAVGWLSFRAEGAAAPGARGPGAARSYVPPGAAGKTARHHQQERLRR